MIRSASALIVGLIAVFIGGCGKEAPKCSDDETSSLVRKIILDQIGGSEGLTEKEIRENLKIELPRASAFDEKIKKYSCEAKLVAGNTYQLPITYESQLDDKGQHIVAVGGISRRDLFVVQAGVIEGIKKERAEKGASTKPESSSVRTPSDQPTTPVTPVAPTNPAADSGAGTAQLSSQALKGPSFDCTKATTFSEKAVCTDALLGKLDGALADNYKKMLASNIGDGAKADLKATQKKWLSERNQCADNQCLVGSYRKRVDEVCDYPMLSGVHPGCITAEEIK